MSGGGPVLGRDQNRLEGISSQWERKEGLARTLSNRPVQIRVHQWNHSAGWGCSLGTAP